MQNINITSARGKINACQIDYSKSGGHCHAICKILIKRRCWKWNSVAMEESWTCPIKCKLSATVFRCATRSSATRRRHLHPLTGKIPEIFFGKTRLSIMREGRRGMNGTRGAIVQVSSCNSNQALVLFVWHFKSRLLIITLPCSYPCCSKSRHRTKWVLLHLPYIILGKSIIKIKTWRTGW